MEHYTIEVPRSPMAKEKIDLTNNLTVIKHSIKYQYHQFQQIWKTIEAFDNSRLVPFSLWPRKKSLGIDTLKPIML